MFNSMRTTITWALVAYYLLTGFYLILLPMTFYQTAPGVVDTGPYNMHFIRDVGFAFTVSALGIAYGIRHNLKPLMLFGVSWLALHGLFHFILWIGHAQHFSATALLDLVLVVVPAIAISYLCISAKV